MVVSWKLDSRNYPTGWYNQKEQNEDFPFTKVQLVAANYRCNSKQQIFLKFTWTLSQVYRDLYMESSEHNIA